MTTGKKQHQTFGEEEVLPQQQRLPFSLTASSGDTSERAERLEMLARIPHEVGTTHLRCTNYQVDKSIREASLASHKQWREEEETLVLHSSNKLKVYLGTKDHPLKIGEARKRICELSDTTALTARITLGLWNIRRANHQLAENGSVAMRIEEVLEWRGIKKHSNRAYPGADRRYTNGYRPQQKEQVLKDLDLLSSCCVQGNVAVTFKGERTNTGVNGSYLRYSIITNETLIAGVFVSPGDWINCYTEQDNYFFAEIDRRVFSLNPQNEQHELRLALFLTERWREHGKRSNNDEPLVMADLLAASMIRVDYNHLTKRFAPRIHEALENLWKKGIIGARSICLTPIDTTHSRWGKDWLASKWRIVPPVEIQQYYETTLRPAIIPKRVSSRKNRRKSETVQQA
jgi:hypothetical protein